MDPVILAGMIFSLLVVLLIGGFIVLFPVTRRLGQALETYLEGRSGGESREEIVRLRRAVEHLRRQVDAIAERQEFVEDLLQEPGGRALPREGAEGRSGRDGG